MTRETLRDTASRIDLLIRSGRVKDAEALVDQVAHGTHPATELQRPNADVNAAERDSEEERGAMLDVTERDDRFAQA